MKVLYSTQSMVEFDGIHYYSNPIQATYKRYASNDDKLVVLCHAKVVSHAYSDLIDNKRIKFVFIKKINSLKALFLNYAGKNRKIIEKVVKEADICFVHAPNQHSTLVIKYAHKFHKPYMTVIGGCAWDALWNYNIKGKFVAPFAYIQLKRIQANATYSIYVTKRFLQRRYPTKGRWIDCSNVNIHAGIESVLYSRWEKIREIGVGCNVIKIATIAAVDVPYKGQADVIKALSVAQNPIFKFEYHLVGGGDNMRLKRVAEKFGVSDKVHFHGALPHDQILDYLDQMDVYIQPSKQEGLPRALIEAMSRGCFCLGTNIAGIPELLDHDHLFQKGDIDGIVAILNSISIEKMHFQAKLNFEKAKEYDVEVLNKKRSEFIDLFKSSISR